MSSLATRTSIVKVEHVVIPKDELSTFTSKWYITASMCLSGDDLACSAFKICLEFHTDYVLVIMCLFTLQCVFGNSAM
jgi:hypothetical protein